MDSDRVFEGEKKRPKGLFYVITFSILNNNKSISEIIERNIVRVYKMNLSKFLKTIFGKYSIFQILKDFIFEGI